MKPWKMPGWMQEVFKKTTLGTWIPIEYVELEVNTDHMRRLGFVEALQQAREAGLLFTPAEVMRIITEPEAVMEVIHGMEEPDK